MTNSLTLPKRRSKFINEKWRLACLDIASGVKLWRIWLTLGWQDISLRYRRSFLGPFWITLSMSVMIYTLGTVYSFLFKTDISSYFPHIACGILLWNFVSTFLLESVTAFVDYTHIITQIKLPFSIHIFRILIRNYITFFHNLIAICPILIYYKKPLLPTVCILDLVLLGLILFCFGMIIATIGARFRDVKQIIHSLLQVIFYLTPVMWMPEMLPTRYSFLIQLNPFQQLIELLRAPLLGTIPPFGTIFSMISLFFLGLIMLFFLLAKTRHRIPFWI